MTVCEMQFIQVQIVLSLSIESICFTHILHLILIT